MDDAERYSLEHCATEHTPWVEKKVFDAADVAQLLRTMRVVVAQILDPETMRAVVIDGTFCVIIIQGACLSKERPPITAVRIPCALWHMVELADWGWQHTRTLHTNATTNAVLCIPRHTRITFGRKKRTRSTPQKLVRTPTPLNMVPTQHLRDNIVIMSVRLVEEKNWGVARCFTLLADVTPISDKVAHYIFSPALLEWLLPFTQINIVK